jgi:outer membrane protein TolC
MKIIQKGNRHTIAIALALLLALPGSVRAQKIMNISNILDSVETGNPSLKVYDANIRSMNETAKGARSWMAPELSTGFFMAPYNTGLWKTGMGQYSIAGQQEIPNKSRLDAQSKYMNAMSTVEEQNKGATLNDLYTQAKSAYYAWLILEKKVAILDQNEKVLKFMISNAEIRYKNGLEKINAYYKAKAALGSLQSMRLMLQNDIRQKRILLNTLMNKKDKLQDYAIDTTYSIKDYSSYVIDSSLFIKSRSDIKAIEKNIQLTYLKRDVERSELKPEFGVRYEHMFGFGGAPDLFTLMGMVRIPIAPWSAKMNKANIEGLKWQAASLNDQKQAVINQSTGMAYSILSEIDLKKKQIELFEKNIIPALRRNYQTMELGYEQNTEELFELYDAWETLNMTQLDYLDQLQQLLAMQVELDQTLQIR